jgi:hypothetical protein
MFTLCIIIAGLFSSLTMPCEKKFERVGGACGSDISNSSGGGSSGSSSSSSSIGAQM